MEYRTTAEIAMFIRSEKHDISNILDPFGWRREAAHQKGEKRKLGDKSPYFDSVVRYCLRERSIIDVGSAIISACGQLSEIEEQMEQILTSGGCAWLIIRLYDANFIQLNFDTSVIKALEKFGLALTIVNRS